MPSEDPSVDHRRRRRAAFERAARAHEHAAEFHLAAADFFAEHGDAARAERERNAAAADAAVAADEHQRAICQ